METKQVHFSKHRDGSFYIDCEVEVPGLGILKIDDCLSNETMENVFREVEAAARIKLNIVRPEVKES
jgi:hypothetical protein